MYLLFSFIFINLIFSCDLIPHLISFNTLKLFYKINKNKNLIYLNDINYVKKGGNRLLYQHPLDKNKVIKILSNHRKKKCYFIFKYLYIRDENVREYIFYNKNKNSPFMKYFPKMYGFINTNKGLGLCYELILNDDGTISKNIVEYINIYGLTEELLSKIKNLISIIKKYNIEHNELNFYNIVVKMNNNKIDNLIIVDGFGTLNFINKFKIPYSNKIFNLVPDIERDLYKY